MARKLTTSEYIEKCIATHGERFDYTQLQYVDSYTKVEIVCKEHGAFQQFPSDHRRGFGCPKCSGKQRGTSSSFIEKARKIHGAFYDYSKTVYKSLEEQVIIICPKHGEFETIARWHIYGSAIGCAQCNRSKGEVRVQEWLKANNIEFTEQKIFPILGTSRFDFYLPNHNVCIEFDGAQHFYAKHQKTKDKQEAQRRFVLVQQRDLKKSLFCIQQGIRLIRISYKQLNNIAKILQHEILCNSTR